ncbi:MAG: hypothetical protein EXQ94_06565 [Alphaproteobacteria bacterium]|nr:hypothetical protein [Alphaproteobacteria bacterium]
MIPKSILVPISGSNASQAALATALSRARAWHGRVIGLHVKVDPRDAIYMASEAVSVQVVEQVVKAATEDAPRRESVARSQFDAAVAAARPADPGMSVPSATFLAETGTETDLIGSFGRAADLIVAGRPDPGRTFDRDDLALEAALFDSGRAGQRRATTG